MLSFLLNKFLLKTRNGLWFVKLAGLVLLMMQGTWYPQAGARLKLKAKSHQPPQAIKRHTNQAEGEDKELDKELDEELDTELDTELDEELDAEEDSPALEGASEALGSSTVNTQDTVSTESDFYEKNLHDIYNQYYSQKITQSKWDQMLQNISGDVYTIKSHDTLWDISRVLFGNPHYWPKLWAVNAGIVNPHLIQTGEELGFIHGSQHNVPSLNIITQGTGGQIGLSRKKKQVTLKAPIHPLQGRKIAIPKPQKKIYPVLHQLPSSLPVLYLNQKTSRFNLSSAKMEYTQLGIPSKSFLHYFQSTSPITALRKGKILRKKIDPGKWAFTTETVILEMQDSVNPGDRLVIAQNKGYLSSVRWGVRGPFGYQVEVQGEVKVLGRVPDSFDLYEAQVTRTFNNPITTGAFVISGPLIEYDFKKTNIIGRGKAQITGFPPDVYQQTTATLYSLVYLNRGSSSGLAVGQMYQVKANPRMHKYFPFGYDIKLGELKIIHTEKLFATGIITAMNQTIHPGDYIIPLDEGLIQDKNYDPLGSDDLENDIKEDTSPTDPNDPFAIEDVEEVPQPKDSDLDQAFEKSSEKQNKTSQDVSPSNNKSNNTKQEEDPFDDFDDFEEI